MGYDGEKDGIPRVIKDSIQYLRETGTRFHLFSTPHSKLFFRSRGGRIVQEVTEPDVTQPSNGCLQSRYESLWWLLVIARLTG